MGQFTPHCRGISGGHGLLGGSAGGEGERSTQRGTLSVTLLFCVSDLPVAGLSVIRSVTGVRRVVASASYEAQMAKMGKLYEGISHG